MLRYDRALAMHSHSPFFIFKVLVHVARLEPLCFRFGKIMCVNYKYKIHPGKSKQPSMDTFVKLATADIDGRCNIVKPFTYRDINRDLNPTSGKVNTKQDVETAWKTWIKITLSKNGSAIPCCDPNLRESEVNTAVLSRVRSVFPMAREIVKNGEITQIQLSTVQRTGPTASTWKLLTPYLICKLSHVLSNPKSTLTQDASDNTVFIAEKPDLLLDCFSQNCPQDDIITVDHLFDAARKDPNYTWADDSKVVQAIIDGNIDFLKTYLFKYNNVNQILTNDDYNNRLIHIATQYYRPAVFDMLVALRPNLNAKNAEGNTPLHFAAKYGSPLALDALIKAGVEMNPKNNYGETPIMLAARYAPPAIDPKTRKPQSDVGLNMAMVRVLYNNGGSMLEKDNKGNNMLHNVILNSPDNTEKSDIIRFALERGVAGDQANKAGKTPLMLIHDKIKASGAQPPAQVKVNSLDLTGMAAALVGGNKGNTLENFQGDYRGLGFDGVNRESFRGQSEGFQVQERGLAELTDQQRELLEIQTLIFNDIIRSNPDKYGGYISVAEIPKGAPIEVLDYMCTGRSSDIQGIESRAECEEKGGEYIKIKTPTTRVKLDLIPESEVAIDKIPEDDVYYNKYPETEIVTGLPSDVNELNKQARSSNNGSLAKDVVTKSESEKRTAVIEGFQSEYTQDRTAPQVPIHDPVQTSTTVAIPTENKLAQIPVDTTGHPAEQSPLIMQKEISLAMQNSALAKSRSSYISNWPKLREFGRANWEMILVLVILSVLFVWFVSRRF